MGISRLQQFITVTLLAVALGWALVAWRQGATGWMAGGLLLIGAGYGGFMALEFALLAWHSRGDALAPRPCAGQLARAWWGEVTRGPRVFCWQQPFRRQRWPDHLPAPGSTDRRGVVLVHGYLCNRAFWNPWMRELRARGVPHVAVDLAPLGGPIDGYAAVIEAAVQSLERATGLAPVIVGHSMGGLAIRAWLRVHAAHGRVHRVVTIGSPHGGTWLARFGKTANAHQMRIGDNDWLRAVWASEPASLRSRFVCFYGHCDNIVFPIGTGRLPGAAHVHVHGVAHVEMAFDRRVMAIVMGLVSAPPLPASHSTSRSVPAAG